MENEISFLCEVISKQKQEIEQLKLICRSREQLIQSLNKCYYISKKEEDEIRIEAYKKFAGRLKCGVPQETGILRCANVDDTLIELEKELGVVGDED